MNVIESLFRDRIDEHVPQLAEHAHRAEQWTKAVEYARAAAVRASAQDAPRAAAEYIDRALVALANLPDDRRAQEEAFALYDMRRNAFQVLGGITEVDRSIRDAAVLADALADPVRQARVARYPVQLPPGDRSSARRGPRRGASRGAGRRRRRPLAEGAGGHLLRQSRFYLGQAVFAAGDYQRAVVVFGQATVRTDEEARRQVGLGGNPHAWLAASLGEICEFDRALQGIEAAQVDPSVERAQGYVTARWAAGLILIRQGDAQRAVAELRRGLEAAEERGAGLWHPIVKGALGLAEALVGHTAAGRDLLEDAIVTGRARLPRIVPFSVSWRAWIYLLEGRLDAATKSGEEAVALARGQGALGDLAWCTWMLGEIVLTAGDLAQAEVRYREAHDLAAPRGMRPLVAHCHLGLGRLSARRGDGQDAAAHVTTATTLYRSMGMRAWLDKAAEVRRDLA